MPDRSLPERRSIRLPGFDYSQPGVYFITVCTHDRKCEFGKIRYGKMIASAAGNAVRETWIGLPNRFPLLALDSFIVMPNHIHAIVAQFRAPQKTAGAASSAPTNKPPVLGTIVRAFKSLAAIEVNRRLGRSAAPLWQRNYFEHVVRRGEDLDAIRQYIRENPMHWEFDHDNPNARRREVISAGNVTPDWLS